MKPIRRKTLRLALLIASIAIALTAAGAYLLRHRLEKKIASELSAHIPFRVEKFEILSWKALFTRAELPIRMTLTEGTFRAAIEGKLALRTAELRFSGTTDIQVADMKLGSWGLNFDSDWPSFKKPKFRLVSQALNHAGLSLTSPEITLQREAESWKGSLTAREFRFEDETRLAVLSQPRLDFELASERWSFKLARNRLDWLSEPTLLRLPFALDLSSTPQNPRHWDLRIEFSPRALLTAEIAERSSALNLSLQTRSLALEEINLLLKQSLSESSEPSALLQVLSGFQKIRGTLDARAELQASATGVEIKRISGELRKAGLSLPSQPLKVENAGLQWIFSTSEGGHLELKAPRIEWKNLRGSLAPYRFIFSALEDFKVKIRRDPKLELLPLRFPSLPFALKSPEGVIDFEAQATPRLKVSSALETPELPLGPLLRRLCVSREESIPPASLSAKFPEILINDDAIETTGTLSAQIFGGSLKITDPALYDASTQVPEIDLDATLEKVSLGKLGQWLNFGEMDGLLEAGLHDAVIQSWLPTHYEFKLEVKPEHRRKVVFSPDAMKNVVQLITGEESTLPGYAQWLAFGWPSRLFGGYDIHYAGVELASDAGLLEVKTLDPPDIFEKERKRYLIFGPRFKMPLKSSQYPLILDATSISNFARRLFIQLDRLRSKENADAPSVPEIPCGIPE